MISVRVKTGLGSGDDGYWTTHRSTTTATSAEFVVVGYRLRKSLSTISNQEQLKTCFCIVIFNQPMVTVIIEKAVKGGHRL